MLPSQEVPFAHALHIQDLGLRDFDEVWTLQKALQRDLIAGIGTQTLLVCEHPPVITAGKSANLENIFTPSAELETRNVQFRCVERGGDVTYHGPGQLVLYPIIDLRTKRCDVGWYMRSLEQVIVQSLQEFKIAACRFPGRTGVWTGDPEHDKKPRKIASIGVRISRWCTLHGFSLNVRDVSAGFAMMNPCGFHDIEMTSLEQEAGLTDLEGIKEALVSQFVTVFDFGR